MTSPCAYSRYSWPFSSNGSFKYVQCRGWSRWTRDTRNNCRAFSSRVVATGDRILISRLRSDRSTAESPQPLCVLKIFLHSARLHRFLPLGEGQGIDRGLFKESPSAAVLECILVGSRLVRSREFRAWTQEWRQLNWQRSKVNISFLQDFKLIDDKQRGYILNYKYIKMNFTDIIWHNRYFKQ